MTRPTAAPRSLTDLSLVVLLTLLLGIQPVTTDLYLPALPTLQQALGASLASAQLTLSSLIIAFGIGQLLCGPLADRFGRRPVLLAGLSLYVLASLLAAMATSALALIGWRALQGLAMAASVTCGRSIVRDLHEPAAGARTMARALGGLGVIATLAPITGGLLVEAWGWRAALLAPAVFGAAALAAIAWRMPETIPRREPEATRPARVWRNWLAVLSNPTFRAWALISACTYGGLFCMLAGSSFVFTRQYGIGRATYGLMLASMSVVYVCGTLWCRHLLRRHGLRGAVARGAGFTLAGGASMALLDLAGVHSPWAILLPQYLYAIGHGVHQPCGQAGAVGPFPEKAGTAASLSGFAMTLTSLGVGLWLGSALDATSLPLTLCIGAFSVVLATVAWTLVQRHGEPARAVAAQAAVQAA